MVALPKSVSDLLQDAVQSEAIVTAFCPTIRRLTKAKVGEQVPTGTAVRKLAKI